MTAETATYWIHPMDHVRHRRWTRPTGPDQQALRLGTPRIA